MNFLSSKSFRARISWLPPLSLISVWALLYLPHLRISPGWYGDETGAFIIGKNLFQGHVSLGSLWLTCWHTYYPIQAGYLWMVGLFSAITGGDILGGRFFNTLLALAIALLIYFLGRRNFNILPAWFGAGMFLTFDQNVIHFRWIYPHNAVALGAAIALLFLLRPSGRRNDWLAGCGLSIAALSHPLFVHAAVASTICRIKRPLAWFRMAAPPTIGLLAGFAVMILIYWPHKWLFDDILNLWVYYKAQSAIAANSSEFHLNFWRFYTQNSFHIAGLFCLIACLRKRFYPIAIFGFTVSWLLLQNRQNLALFYYQAIVLSPVLSMASAASVYTTSKILRRSFRRHRIDKFCVCATLFLPSLLGLSQLPAVLSGNLLPANQFWVTQDIREVEAAANWLNRNVGPEDLVIANTNIAWLLNSRIADHFQVVLWAGLPTEYFPEGIDRERFRFPADLDSVKYFVIGDIDRRWTLGQLNMNKLTARLLEEKWHPEWCGPNYLILSNPRFQLATPEGIDSENFR